jgi:hypothetical protein
MRIRHLQAAAAGALVASGLLGGTALASAHASHVGPTRIYAPYFETYRPDSLAVMARRAGVRYVTLAFAQAAGWSGANACRLVWGGIGVPLSQGRYRSAVRALRAKGGGAIVSFGGWTADQSGTEIAESCHSVRAIAAAYERVVTGLGVDRLSMDLEGPVALTGEASISRRSKAIARLERWARARKIPLWVQLTLPVLPKGLNRYTTAIVRNAATNHASINSISLMVFDYYFFHERAPLKMGALGIRAAVNAHRQLRTLYPKLTSAQIWRKLGFTMMAGIDGYPRGTEVTNLRDARLMMNFALAKQMRYLSIWALQRDNGGCPGLPNAGTCSGIKQRRWAFSHLLERFVS